MRFYLQMSIDSSGTMAVVWDESGTGTRRLAGATGRVDSGGRVHFERRSSAHDVGTYPVVASTGTGAWLQAWTSGAPDRSVVRVSPLE